MSVPGSIEAGGTDEEIERYLSEFARLVQGWAARDARGGGTAWIVGSGSPLSTNPNTVPWRLRVARREGGLEFRPEAFRLPWTRAKGARLSFFRQGQLTDFLETRLRGGAPDRFDARRLREPFSPFGSGPAALTASFAWGTACACGALALAFLALLVPCLALMQETVPGIADRALAVQSAGDIPLPSAAEIESGGFGLKLGSAALLAFPIAFFLGLVHALALLAGELHPRAARLGQASAAFQAIFLGLAFAPLIPFTVAIPSAFLVPFATHAGYSLVWGRRRERVREQRPPRRAVVIAGFAAAAAVAAALVPRPAESAAFRDNLALFRDRYLVGHPLGKAAVHFYYRHTLYAADPVKRFFAADGETPQRSQRTARVTPGSEAGALLRKLDFSVRVLRPGANLAVSCDVVLEGDTLRSAGAEVRWDPASGLEGLSQALDRLSGQAFRGGWLLDLSALSWRAVYYAGLPFALVLFIGACCPAVSIIFRVMSPKAAAFTLLACMASTGGLMLWDYSRQAGAQDRLEGLRNSPGTELIARGLKHPSPAVRHEAAYQAYRLEEGNAALAEALLGAAGDEDLRIRLWAVAALGKTRDPRALDTILERLEDPEFLVRYRAAEGLGLLGLPAAAEPLRRRMREGGWYEGLYALQALRRIHPDRF